VSNLYRKSFNSYGEEVYVDAGHDFTGFPMNGIWCVYKGSHSGIIPLTDVTKMPIFAMDYLSHKNELLDAFNDRIDKNGGKGISLNEMAEVSALFFANQLEKNIQLMGSENMKDIYEYKKMIRNMLNSLNSLEIVDKIIENKISKEK
jgi:hypothetical protein